MTGLALRTGRTVHDRLYVGLAFLLDGPVVTADDGLIAGLRASGFAGGVRHVGALP